MNVILAPFPAQVPLGAELAELLGCGINPVHWRHFPDGESLIRLEGDFAEADVCIIASLNNPDRLALPLRFAARTARELGARSVGLVAPYLGYMRQDTRFHPGEAVSARLFAEYLDETFDWLVTADPHLHRNPHLQPLFGIPATKVDSAPLLAAWISSHVPDAVVIGPDSESQQWVADVARHAGVNFEVLQKTRRGDRDVEIKLPTSPEFLIGTPVILDDIASSGRTILETLRQISELGGSRAICVVIHPVFAGTAYKDILSAGAAQVVSTNSIPHPSNAISIAAPLAAAISKMLPFQRV